MITVKDGSDDYPLVRIYDFSAAEAQNLRETFQALADGSIEHASFEVAESIDGTPIVFARSTLDQGVVERGEHRFEVALTAESWLQAAGFTEPFCNGSLGHQWLTQTRGIQLLLSKLVPGEPPFLKIFNRVNGGNGVLVSGSCLSHCRTRFG